MSRVNPKLLAYSIFQLLNCGLALLALVSWFGSLHPVSRALTVGSLVVGIGGAVLLLIKVKPGLVLSYITLALQLMRIQWGRLLLQVYQPITFFLYYQSSYSNGRVYAVGMNVVAVFWLIWLSWAARTRESATEL